MTEADKRLAEIKARSKISGEQRVHPTKLAMAYEDDVPWLIEQLELHQKALDFAAKQIHETCKYPHVTDIEQIKQACLEVGAEK